MKKFISVILVLVMVLGLAACGSKAAQLPDGFDQALYDYTTAAYELVRDYNLGKVDKDSAKSRAETISKNIEALPEPKNNSKLSDDTFKTIYDLKKSGVLLDLSMFTYQMTMGDSTVNIENNLKNALEK